MDICAVGANNSSHPRCLDRLELVFLSTPVLSVEAIGVRKSPSGIRPEGDLLHEALVFRGIDPSLDRGDLLAVFQFDLIGLPGIAANPLRFDRFCLLAAIGIDVIKYLHPVQAAAVSHVDLVDALDGAGIGRRAILGEILAVPVAGAGALLNAELADEIVS